MHTLFDFITHIKAVEYIVAILSIAGFIMFWEVLKSRPFSTVVNEGRADLEHLKGQGTGQTMKSIGRIAAAPFIGLAYVMIVPVGFFIAIALGIVNVVLKAANGLMGLLGKQVAFEWRPMEAYFTGEKKKRKEEEKESP